LNFPDESEPGRVIVSSSDATLHENYNSFTINNDIAVIRLSEAVSGPSKIFKSFNLLFKYLLTKQLHPKIGKILIKYKACPFTLFG